MSEHDEGSGPRDPATSEIAGELAVPAGVALAPGGPAGVSDFVGVDDDIVDAEIVSDEEMVGDADAVPHPTTAPDPLPAAEPALAPPPSAALARASVTGAAFLPGATALPGDPFAGIATPAFDYSDAGVPTLDYLRDKISGKLGLAEGSVEIAQAEADRSAVMRAQQESRLAAMQAEAARRDEAAAAERAQKAEDRLEEIRRSLGKS